MEQDVKEICELTVAVHEMLERVERKLDNLRRADRSTNKRRPSFTAVFFFSYCLGGIGVNPGDMGFICGCGEPVGISKDDRRGTA